MTAVALRLKRKRKIKPPKPPSRLTAVLLFFILSVITLWWRITDTVPELGCDIVYTIGCLIDLWAFGWKPLHRLPVWLIIPIGFILFPHIYAVLIVYRFFYAD